MKESFSKAQVSLRDYLFIIFHRKKYFLLPALIVFFTASIGSFFLPKYYSSTVLVLVEEEQKAINPLAARPTYVSGKTTTLVEQLKTLSEKILNYPQLRMVVRELGLDKTVKDPLEMEKLIYSIRKRVDVKLRSPEVFEVSYEDKDPRKAKQVVNTLVASFINYNIAKKEKRAMIGVDFAESQAEVYRKKLQESEQRFYEFREKFPLQTAGKETDLNVSLLINYQTQLTSAKLTLGQIEKEKSIIKDQLNGRKPVQIRDDLWELNPAIDLLNKQITNLQLQLDDLLQNDLGSEKIVELQVEINDLRRRLSRETEKLIDHQTPQTAPLLFKKLEQQKIDNENQIAIVEKRIIELKKLVGEYEERIASLPEQDKNLANLVRDQRVNNNIYEMLRLKVEENRLDAIELQQRGIRYEILAEGRLPLKPSKPKKLIISIVALVLGMLTGFGCVFLVEMSDHSFRDIEDAKRFLDVPLIGSTMRIMTRQEFKIEQKKRRYLIVILILILLLSIFIGVTSSFMQEKKLTEQIVQEQMMRDQ